MAARLLGMPTFPNVSRLVSTFIKVNGVTRVVHHLNRTAFSGATQVFFQNSNDRALFEALGLVPCDYATTVPGSGIGLDQFAPRERPQRRGDGVVFPLIACLL